MTQANAYISFPGTCREALTFYNEAIGGDLEIQVIEGSPVESQCPPDMKDKVLHATLTLNGSLFLAGSDLGGPNGYVQGNNVSLFITCNNREELDRFYAHLSQGAKSVYCEPGIQFWGGVFASFVDKFGIGWALNCMP